MAAADALGGLSAAWLLDPERVRARAGLPVGWVSSTFHGRDVFAPAAALLSASVDPANDRFVVGLVRFSPLALPKAEVTDEGAVADVVEVDRFGNVGLALRFADFSPGTGGVHRGDRRRGPTRMERPGGADLRGTTAGGARHLLRFVGARGPCAERSKRCPVAVGRPGQDGPPGDRAALLVDRNGSRDHNGKCRRSRQEVSDPRLAAIDRGLDAQASEVRRTSAASGAASNGARDAAAPGAATPQTLLAVYRPDIAQALAAMDAPSYRYAQVYEHLFRRPLRSFAEATVLPTDTRAALDGLGVSTLTIAGSRSSPDGATKLLLAGRDGSHIETVIMRYRDRVTVCISSQVGCPVGCGFCATGAMGFRRNLSTAEIVDQVRPASALVGEEDRRVSNLVYMGMGEPLLNLQAVLDSIRILTDPQGMGVAHRALSVSTIGIPSGILRLARAEPQVNLALSLHAADDRTRALLVPPSFRHPLSEILESAWEHFAITHRKLLIEYVLLDGVNDSVDDARRLAALLRGHVVTVNLLAWNPVPNMVHQALGRPSDREPARLCLLRSDRPPPQPSRLFGMRFCGPHRGRHQAE